MSESTEWRVIRGYESYAVSDDGRVKRVLASGKYPSGYVLRGHNRLGYISVTLSRHSERPRQIFIHQIVVRNFIGDPLPGHEVRHLDGNSLNNRLTNLAWGTHSQNELDKVAHGNHKEARKTECPHGHPYDFANTLRSTDGKRRCRACMNARRRTARKLRLHPAEHNL